jgi:Flp pilus assembly protein TadB
VRWRTLDEGDEAHSKGRLARVQQRHALALLFVVLCLSFAGIAVAAAGAGVWVVAVAAGALGVWLGSLALKAGRRR